MAQVRFFLHTNKEALDKLKLNPNYFRDPDNRVPIKFGLTVNRKRLKLSTRLFINPNNWDRHKRRVISKEPYADYINDTLQLIQEKVFKMFISARSGDKPGTFEYFKTELTNFIELAGDEPVIGRDTQTFFWQKFDEFLEYSTDKTDSTKRNYQNTFNQLKRFCKKYELDLRFSTINKVFLAKLQHYYTKELRITVNTQGKHLKNLKSFLKDSYEKKYHTNKIFEEIKVERVPVEIVSLEIEEVKALKNIVLDRKALDESRDIFLMGVYTGLRHSDIAKINSNMVDGEFLLFVSKKTDRVQKTYINRYVRQLLEKYDYCMPSTSVQVVDRHLKEIAALAKLNRQVLRVKRIGRETISEYRPLHEVISTHIAKKTYITLFFQEGGRMETLQKSTGNTDKATIQNHYMKVKDKGIKNEIDEIMDKLDY